MCVQRPKDFCGVGSLLSPLRGPRGQAQAVRSAHDRQVLSWRVEPPHLTSSVRSCLGRPLAPPPFCRTHVLTSCAAWITEVSLRVKTSDGWRARGAWSTGDSHLDSLLCLRHFQTNIYVCIYIHILIYVLICITCLSNSLVALKQNKENEAQIEHNFFKVRQLLTGGPRAQEL